MVDLGLVCCRPWFDWAAAVAAPMAPIRQLSMSRRNIVVRVNMFFPVMVWEARLAPSPFLAEPGREPDTQFWKKSGTGGKPNSPRDLRPRGVAVNRTNREVYTRPHCTDPAWPKSWPGVIVTRPSFVLPSLPAPSYPHGLRSVIAVTTPAELRVTETTV